MSFVPDNSSPQAAIVTGASRGIGEAIAYRLARDGARVVVTGRDGERLETVVGRIRADGGEAISLAADLREAATAERLVTLALESFGGIDLLVNNAGATKRGLFLDLSDADFADGFALKFFGAVRLTRAAWPHLKARRGSVLFISGIGGRTPGAEFTIGGSVNAALLSLTKALAEQGTADGIQVNAVSPGRVRTDRLTRRLQALATQEKINPEEAERRMLDQAGLVRFGEPEDIANLVAFIMSEQGCFFQGSLIEMDGGEVKTI
jgi:3-oxoacyl-[acyl-carrier protein] reductase